MEKIDPFTGRTLQVKSDGNMSLHFLCAYDFSPVGNGYLIPNGREFASQIMPILQLSIILLKEVLNSGARMYNLPLPVHSWDPTTVKEMFSIMQMVFVNEEKPMEEQKRIEDNKRFNPESDLTMGTIKPLGEKDREKHQEIMNIY